MHITKALQRTFQSKPFRGSSYNNTVAAKYRAKLRDNPFLFFGMPFILTMVAGSFFLTPAQALRYETHDKKVTKVTQEEAIGIKKGRRRVDMNEEYYKLAARDLENWENKRVERLPGESENLWENDKKNK